MHPTVLRLFVIYFILVFFSAGAAAKISSFVCCFVGFVGCCRRRRRLTSEYDLDLESQLKSLRFDGLIAVFLLLLAHTYTHVCEDVHYKVNSDKLRAMSVCWPCLSASVCVSANGLPTVTF